MAILQGQQEETDPKTQSSVALSVTPPETPVIQGQKKEETPQQATPPLPSNPAPVTTPYSDFTPEDWAEIESNMRIALGGSTLDELEQQRKQAEEEANKSWINKAGEYVTDIARGIDSAPFKLYEGYTNVFWGALDAVDKAFGTDVIPESWTRQDLTPDMFKPQTGVGKFVGTITADMLGAMLVNNIVGIATTALRGTQLTTDLSKVASLVAWPSNEAGNLAKWSSDVIKMGISDYVFDGNDETNFANVLQTIGAPGEAIWAYLAADKDDGVLERRAKRALVNILPNYAWNAALSGISHLWKIRHTKDPLQRMGARQEAVETIRDILGKQKEAETAAGGFIPDGSMYTKEVTDVIGDFIPSSTGKNAGLNLKTIHPAFRKVGKALNDAVGDAAADLAKQGGDEFAQTAQRLIDIQDTCAKNLAGLFDGIIETTDCYIAEPTTEVLEQLKEQLAITIRAGATLKNERSWFGRALQSIKRGVQYGPDEPLATTAQKLTEKAVKKSAQTTVAKEASAVGRGFNKFLNTAKDTVKRTPNEDVANQILDKVLSNKDVVDRLTDAFDAKGIQDIVVRIKTLRDAKYSPSEINTWLLKAVSPAATAGNTNKLENGVHALNEFTKFFWYNGVLSNPKTHIANALGNAANTWIVHPMDMAFESIAQGVMDNPEHKLRGFVDGFTNGLQKSAEYYKGTWAVWDKVKSAALTSFHNGGIGLLDSSSRLDMIENVTGTAQPKSLFQRIYSIPTRALSASDEAFKQLAYGGELRAQFFDELAHNADLKTALKTAEKAGVKKDVIEDLWQSFASTAYGTAVTGSGQLLQGVRGLNQKALEVAKELTWQTDLTGNLAKSLSYMQKACNNIPGGYLLMPFLKTPFNIGKDVFWNHNPIGILRLLSQTTSPAMKAKIIGQAATATVLWGIGWELASNGFVTGSGPKDKESRDFLMQNGWQPNSLKLGNKYVEIGQMEPICAPLILCANVYETMSRVDPNNPSESANPVATAFNCLVHYTADKTYLKQVGDIVRAIDGDESFWPSFLRSSISSAVPSVLNGFRKLDWVDPMYREATTVLSSVKNRVPGLSSDLAPRHSFITGTPVFYDTNFGSGAFYPGIKTGKNDPLLLELSKTGRHVTRPSRTVTGYELTDEQYSEFCKLHGEVKIGGRTLYKALTDLINSPTYKKAAPNPSENTLSLEKEEMIVDVISRYRRHTVQMYNRQHPDLVNAMLQARKKLQEEQKNGGQNNSNNQTAVATSNYSSITQF